LFATGTFDDRPRDNRSNRILTIALRTAREGKWEFLTWTGAGDCVEAIVLDALCDQARSARTALIPVPETRQRQVEKQLQLLKSRV
jgi:hypothetical protein